MKNIHVKATDKPSKLIIYSTLLNEFRLLDEPIEDWEHKKNIYITSNEEIKLNDYVIQVNFEKTNTQVIQCVNEFQVKIANDKDGSFTKNKIILTTDQDLIKDGVQPIDDEFLEWFVKNPSCEEIETKLVKQRSHLTLNDWVDEDENGKFPISIAGAFCYRKIYKIIIPKEEIRDINAHTGFDEEGHSLNYQGDILPLVKKEPKQETLEEAGEKLYPNRESFLYRFQNIERKAFTEGAKWQQERSYNEEDMREAFNNGDWRWRMHSKVDIFKEWLEQFKKK